MIRGQLRVVPMQQRRQLVRAERHDRPFRQVASRLQSLARKGRVRHKMAGLAAREGHRADELAHLTEGHVRLAAPFGLALDHLECVVRSVGAHVDTAITRSGVARWDEVAHHLEEAARELLERSAGCVSARRIEHRTRKLDRLQRARGRCPIAAATAAVRGHLWDRSRWRRAARHDCRLCASALNNIARISQRRSLARAPSRDGGQPLVAFRKLVAQVLVGGGAALAINTCSLQRLSERAHLVAFGL